jgi:hypothetical protein
VSLGSAGLPRNYSSGPTERRSSLGIRTKQTVRVGGLWAAPRLLLAIARIAVGLPPGAASQNSSGA